MIDSCWACTISRRRFIQRAVYAAAGTTLTDLTSTSGQGPRGSREVMREFPYGAVQLTGGPHQAALRSHLRALSRSFDNDRLLKVPQPLRTLSIGTENPNLAALMRGAVMYVGLSPWDSMGEQAINLPGSLSPLSGSRQAYRTVVAGRDVVFVPYFTIDTERYNTYFRIA